MHPPDPEMQRAARQGGPDCKVIIHGNKNTEIAATLQARRIARLYAVAFATAAAVAELAYAVGAP
jgi:hypothetical protein